MTEDAVRLNVPMIISEFAACSNSMNCAEEISNSCDAFDSALASWAHWQFKGYGDFTTSGNTNEGLYGYDG
jgi:endoglycosylceramidase